MQDYLINIALSYSWFLLFGCLAVAIKKIYLKDISDKKSNGAFTLYFVVTLIYCTTGSDITYKHTTNYDKVADIYKVKMQNNLIEIKPIIDKSRQPKKTDEDRKRNFDNMVDYETRN